MITYVQGNLFESSAQVLTNAVNCVGIMGKGIALEFKKRYPAMFCEYVARCTAGQMKMGEPWLWEDDEAQILNFPTKRHWRTPSSLEDIEAGLRWLALKYGELGIYTIAMPALGCGNGGLSWNEVQLLMEKHLGSIPDLEVFVYPDRAGASLAITGDDHLTRQETGKFNWSASPTTEQTLFGEFGAHEVTP
jgi:O-acetyl-ADP-ribose deacetylase (regulator of RNase III)